MKNLYTTKISLVLNILFLLFCQLQINAQWSKQIIEDNLNRPTSFFPGDIDGDGDNDIAAAIFGQRQVVWYEYDNSEWNKHLVDNNLGAVGLFIIDLDKDGKNDIVAAGFASNAVKWYKNSGETPVGWTGNVIDNSLSGSEWVYVADIDGDDDLDVVATGSTGDCVVWYENDGSCTNWTKHFVDQNLNGAVVCQVIDIDGDENPDIVANGMQDGVLAWYKNGSSGKDWTKNTIDNLPGISEFDVADIDNDNDFDIVASGADQNNVVLFENMGGETVNWTKYIIDGNLGGVFAVEFADLDSDTIPDVVATGNRSNQVVWYKNNGGSPDTWSKTIIDPAFPDAWDLITINTEGKGFPDIIVNQFVENGSIAWYKNPYSQYVNIPDTAFLYALIDEGVDTNGDSLISYGEAEFHANLDISEKGISDMTGIEAFINLDTLKCRSNQLTSLDVSNNTVLASLNCYGNQLTSLNLSGCEELTGLSCDDNQLTSLDVTNNTALTELYCAGNQLTNLDITTLFALRKLSCYGNQLSNLNTFHNPELDWLSAGGNLLTSVDFSNNPLLEQLYLADNLLASLNISNNTAIEILDIQSMPSLHEVCVWTTPFPPEDVIVVSGGSPNVSFLTDCNVFVLEGPKQQGISIYPNPTYNLLTIEASISDQYTFEIISLNGQLILSKKMEGTTHQIDLSLFQKGVYFITIRLKDFVTTRKIIKL
jgi:hypothetical protein